MNFNRFKNTGILLLCRHQRWVWARFALLVLLLNSAGANARNLWVCHQWVPYWGERWYQEAAGPIFKIILSREADSIASGNYFIRLSTDKYAEYVVVRFTIADDRTVTSVLPYLYGCGMTSDGTLNGN